jgi:hypothetical protein
MPDGKSIAVVANLFKSYSAEGVNGRIIMDEVLAGDPADWGQAISFHRCE